MQASVRASMEWKTRFDFMTNTMMPYRMLLREAVQPDAEPIIVGQERILG